MVNEEGQTETGSGAMEKEEEDQTQEQKQKSFVYVNHYREFRHVEKRHGQDSWQFKALKLVHSTAVQLTLAGLLILDVVSLVVELLLDAQYPVCHVVLRNCIASNTSELLDDFESHSRVLAAEERPGELGLGECFAHCQEHPHSVEVAHQALFGISIAVLVVFELELLFVLYLIGCLFFRHLLYVLDFVVVTVSLVVELALRNQAEASASGLLVAIRTWRFIRIGHGIFADTHEYEHHKVEKLKTRIKELEFEVQHLKKKANEESLVQT